MVSFFSTEMPSTAEVLLCCRKSVLLLVCGDAILVVKGFTVNPSTHRKNIRGRKDEYILLIISSVEVHLGVKFLVTARTRINKASDQGF